MLIGHGRATIIIETSVDYKPEEINEIVERIAGKDMDMALKVVPQDIHLSTNQEKEIRCGDNGIFKGVPLTDNEKHISALAKELYSYYPVDGKYILTDDKFICCQSNASNEELKERLEGVANKVIINPLGEWTGGTDVDTGATNRKLGSDMAQSVTGGGLHGKDLSKADVSVNIYAFLKAQEAGKVVELCCAIGDDTIDGKPYSEIVEIAREIYEDHPYDGKYILDDDKFIICQSNTENKVLEEKYKGTRERVIVNPLGEWTGGTNVDSGATNRKLGSDMAQSVTGGGLHGKDLSKADVSVNIYAFLKAQETGKIVELCCAIGDDTIDGKPYSEIVEIARNYIKEKGGFEKFAEWGLF